MQTIFYLSYDMVVCRTISNVIDWMDSELEVDNLSDQIYCRFVLDVHNARWTGMGESAGGLEAIGSFTSGLSAENEATYLILQHIASQQKSLLSEIIEHNTALTVVEAADNLQPRLGTV